MPPTKKTSKAVRSDGLLTLAHGFDRCKINLDVPDLPVDLGTLLHCKFEHINCGVLFAPTWQSRLTLHQPSRADLRRLADALNGRVRGLINDIEIAYDVQVGSQIAAAQIDAAFLGHVHLRHDRRKLRREAAQAAYIGAEATDRGTRAAKRLALYSDKASKLADRDLSNIAPACHFEMRLTGKEPVEAAGIVTLRDLVEFDHHQFWADRLEVWKPFAATDIGKRLAKGENLTPSELTRTGQRWMARFAVDGVFCAHNAWITREGEAVLDHLPKHNHIDDLFKDLAARVKLKAKREGATAGLRNLLQQQWDVLFPLDEMRQAADVRGLLNLVFDAGNSASRVTSSPSQQLQRSTALRLGVLFTNEESLTDMANRAGIELADGTYARVLEIYAKAGVFENVPENMTPKAYAERLQADSDQYFGALWDAWLAVAAADPDAIKGRFMKQIGRIEESLKKDLTIDDPVTNRMISGLAAAVFAGDVAVEHKLLNTDRKAILAAARRIIRERLATLGSNSTPTRQLVIAAAKDALDRSPGRFAPLAEFAHGTRNGLLGYTHQVGGEPVHLFLTSAFKDILADRFSERFALDTLEEAGYLITTPSREHRYQVRIPGGTGNKKDFYAIRDAIRYDNVEEPAARKKAGRRAALPIELIGEIRFPLNFLEPCCHRLC